MPDGVPLAAAEPPAGELVGEWMLRAVPESAAIARRLVGQALDGAQEPLCRRATLVTSELVGNGVRHTGGGVVLRVHRLVEGWLMSVRDSSQTPPRLRPDAGLTESGRGLLIVARVSEDVGWARTPDGKVVWARLDDDSA